MSDRTGQTHFGLLLPHFGSFATRTTLLDGSRRIEALGFDSVWVRDHLVYQPHAHEDPDRTHLDPLVVLSAVAAVTERLTLGTGVLIPHRHPIHAALLIGSLERLAAGRVIAGFGLGAFDHEFAAIGEGTWDRREMIEEYVRLVRALLVGEEISHAGTFFQFTKVGIAPTPPPSSPIPLWYGGPSLAAARRAVEYCDGYLATRTPRSALANRLRVLDRHLALHQKERPPIGIVPYISPAATVEEGARFFNLPALLADTARLYSDMPGKLERLGDLEGAAIAGPPDVIVDEITRYLEMGVTHVVFDLRTRFADWFDCLELIGTDVLPILRNWRVPNTAASQT